MKHTITTTLLFLCAALFTSCGGFHSASMKAKTDRWGWTNQEPDPGPPFKDHSAPRGPYVLNNSGTVAQPTGPAGTPGIGGAANNGPTIGTMTSHLPQGAIPAPPKQSDTPEFSIPAPSSKN